MLRGSRCEDRSHAASRNLTILFLRPVSTIRRRKSREPAPIPSGFSRYNHSTANEMFPEVLFSIYALDWQGSNRGLTAGVYQAYQNFPKAIKSSGGIVLKLMPPSIEMQRCPRAARTSRFISHSMERYDRRPDRGQGTVVSASSNTVLDPQVCTWTQVYLAVWYPTSTITARKRFLFRYVDSGKGLG